MFLLDAKQYSYEGRKSPSLPEQECFEMGSSTFRDQGVSQEKHHQKKKLKTHGGE